MPYSRPWTTNRCRWVPVQPKAVCITACRPAIVVSAGTSSRRQISGLTPRTTTRSWYTLGRGAGCMVSGMAPILASRCGRTAPGMAPPTVCPALPVEVGVMTGAGPPRDVVQGEDRTAEGESLPFGAVQLLQRAGQGGRATAGPPALLGGTR